MQTAECHGDENDMKPSSINYKTDYADRYTPRNGSKNSTRKTQHKNFQVLAARTQQGKKLNATPAKRYEALIDELEKILQIATPTATAAKTKLKLCGVKYTTQNPHYQCTQR